VYKHVLVFVDIQGGTLFHVLFDNHEADSIKSIRFELRVTTLCMEIKSRCPKVNM